MNDGDMQETNSQQGQPLSEPAQPSQPLVIPQQYTPVDASQTVLTTEGQVQQAAVPATPIQPQMPISASQIAAKKPRSKKLLFVAVLVPLLLIGGGAYGYLGVYMQTPQQLWNSAMKNTGEGLKQYASTTIPEVKTTKIQGTFAVSSPAAVDIAIDGAISGNTAQSTLSLGMSGVRLNAELRSLKAPTGTSPDIYVKVEGIKGLGDLLGGGPLSATIDGLEGKWYVIDHTLIDQALLNTENSKDPKINPEELNKELELAKVKVADVVSTYLFTTDDSKAMVVMKEAKGKEDFKGRKSQRVVAQLRKQQTHDMFVALKDAIKETKLDDWIIAGEGGKSFEEVINFTDLLKEVDSANYDDAVADVWIDTSLRYVRNVQLTIQDSKDKTKSAGTVDFTLDYKGGDEFPFMINIVSTEKDNEGTFDIGFTVKKGSPDFKFTGALEANDNGSKLKGSMNMTITGSNEEIKVEKPAGATNIVNLLSSVSSNVQQLQNDFSQTLGAVTFRDDTELQ